MRGYLSEPDVGSCWDVPEDLAVPVGVPKDQYMADTIDDQTLSDYEEGVEFEEDSMWCDGAATYGIDYPF